jgi:hypothetical protein
MASIGHELDPDRAWRLARSLAESNQRGARTQANRAAHRSALKAGTTIPRTYA